MSCNHHNKEHRTWRKTIIILHAVTVVILFMIAVQPSVLSETQPTPAPISPDEARKANDEAQAEYYRVQTEKLKQPPPSKTFWQGVVDNPASVLGVFGVFVAALVTLFSFFFNYRATLRNQRDTQFYEALKRFGDKDSPAIRSSAAGLLGQMAWTKQLGVKPKRTSRRFRTYFFTLTWHRPYFSTVLQQLISGLLLEDNPVVLASISGSLNEIGRLDPDPILRRVHSVNRWLQNDLVNTLAEFSAVIDSLKLGDAWSVAESLTGYNKEVLQDLVKRSKQDFASSALRGYGYAAMPTDKRQEQLSALQHDLRIAAERLRADISAFTEALRLVRPKRSWIWQRIWRKWRGLGRAHTYDAGLYFEKPFLVKAELQYMKLGGFNTFDTIEMPDAQLREADLEATKLEYWNLRRAQLQGANLVNTKMDETQLYGACIDANTNLEGATWWKANFYRATLPGFNPEQPAVIDTPLLEELFRRYGEPKVSDSHFSVQMFMDRRHETEPKVAQDASD